MGLDETSTRIIRAVKAEAARRSVTGKEIALALGRDKKYVYERFRFEKPFALSDLEPISAHIGISVEMLWASAQLDTQMRHDAKDAA